MRNFHGEKSRRNPFAYPLICLGIICLVISSFLIWQRYNPQKLAFAKEPIGEISAINSSQTPKGIIIEDLGISLEVVPSRVNNGKWEATDKGVSYLTTSPLPGEIGNSIFYGHNWPNLLGKLINIKVGQKITVLYDDNSTKNFIVSYTQEVSPEMVEILNNSSDRRITIYTCSGFLDTKRFVVVAHLSE